MENAELIKALRCKEYFDLCNVKSCRYHITNTKSGCKCAIELLATDAATALEAADRRIAELKAAQRWIPVEEQLPEHDQDVLAITKAGNLSVGQNIVTCTFCKPRNEKHGLFYLPYAMGRTLIVTHWQPLPQPPQKGE